MKIRFCGLAARLCFSLLVCTGATARAGSPLFEHRYTVLPVPQKVTLRQTDVSFTRDWRITLGPGVAASDVAVESLEESLTDRFQLKLHSLGKAEAARRRLLLQIQPGSVAVGPATDHDRTALAEQAYRIEMAPDQVRITGNAPTGLFYGVQTFLQLLTRHGHRLVFPEGVIEDWPDLQLRSIYWDDAHHLEHLDVLKAALRQAAFYKINGFALKLEGHFEFHSAPAIVEPYALTAAQLQELTDYALRYHIQLIPYLDAPAHVSFILKHPEYAPLREFPNCNYEFCVLNPQTEQLLKGMFQDLLDANRGAKYFVLSTDEPYYLGLAHGPGCDEASRARELGGVGKLLAEFISRSAQYLHDRGRTVLFWGEYPLKPEDIGSLPAYLVNGETYGPKFDPIFKAHGIRQLIYTSTQGEEPLFPNYYPLRSPDRLHSRKADQGEPGRVAEMVNSISSAEPRQQADLMGAFVAGWADAGLHPETFWLGYATGPAVAWHPEAADPDELMRTFYSLFYGPKQQSMPRLYELMSRQARFWEDSWETRPSMARTAIFGNSSGVFERPRPAQDQTLAPLPVPESAGLELAQDWSADNARRLELARRFLSENEELIELLQENRARVAFNRYNLEVFLSIAQLCRENLDLLLDLQGINAELKLAHEEAKSSPKAAVAHLDAGLDLAAKIWRRRNQTYQRVVATWYRSWYPRVAKANGRRYLDQVDDVKDHRPVRTVDMSYLIYRELQYPLGEWAEATRRARNAFALAHGLGDRNEKLDWRNCSRH